MVNLGLCGVRDVTLAFIFARLSIVISLDAVLRVVPRDFPFRL